MPNEIERNERISKGLEITGKKLEEISAVLERLHKVTKSTAQAIYTLKFYLDNTTGSQKMGTNVPTNAEPDSDETPQPISNDSCFCDNCGPG